MSISIKYYSHTLRSTPQARAARREQLQNHPICQNVQCLRPAEVVDHIIPILEGGSEWKSKNLKSYCRSCHDKKSRRDVRRQKQKRIRNDWNLHNKKSTA